MKNREYYNEYKKLFKDERGAPTYEEWLPKYLFKIRHQQCLNRRAKRKLWSSHVE